MTKRRPPLAEVARYSSESLGLVFLADGDVTGSGRNNGSEVGLSVFVFDF